MHWTTLVQRCRSTNSLLADEIDAEFRRLESELETARDLLRKATVNPYHEPRKRFSTHEEPYRHGEQNIPSHIKPEQNIPNPHK